MNKFLEYLKDTSTVICCNGFEELLQFFEIMKNNGYELSDKTNDKYTFFINDNKTFEFTIAANYFDNILFPSFSEKINFHNKLWNGMTMEEAHRKMWNDLADGKVESKGEWLNLHNTNMEKIPIYYCFACEASLDNNRHRDCNRCPLIINGKRTVDGDPCLYGLFDEWCDATDFEKFELAHEIANLPWDEVNNE